MGTNVYVPEKHALAELEPPSAFNPKPRSSRITKPWLALILQIVEVVRGIIGAKGTGGGIVVADNSGRALVVRNGLAVVPYDAAHFSAIGGTWLVEALDIRTWAWGRLGPIATLALWLEATAVVGAPTLLIVNLPGDSRAAHSIRTLIELDDNGAAAVGVAWVEENGTRLLLKRLDGDPFTAGAVSVRGEILIEVED
jgi:hypothetical protein